MGKMKKQEILNEINVNRNHSWFEEIKNRSNSHLLKPAFKYRGKSITYNEYLKTCEQIWAPSLKANGIGKNTEIVACLSSTPELCYLLGAVSIVGAKINLVSSDFDADYLYQIIKNADSKYVFVGEDRFNELMPIFKRLELEKDKTIVPISLDYSLSGNNPFAEITDKFLGYNKEEYLKNVQSLSNCESINSFLNKGTNYTGKVGECSTLDDEFTITYSSGTTDGKMPKGIVHRNRHYIVMGRYHDSEVSGIPNLKDSVTYSTIPTQSNSYIASILSDTLMEGACIALDPIVSKEYFIYGILINEPYMAIATTSSWLYTAKYYYNLSKEEQQKIKFPNTLFPVVVGEPMSPGEEKYLNKFIKDTKCGTGVTKLPYSISKMSICGGDCEHGSIFIRELRAYANLLRDKSVHEPIGLRTYNFVEVKALRSDGTYCNPNEYGRLVANSDCTMVGYKDAPERTKNFFVTDAYGKTWGDLGCHGFIDKNNNIYMKGRVSEDKSIIPEFIINDEIQRDTKNILSSSVVSVTDNDIEKYVAYIEVQPNSKKKIEEIIKSAIMRCQRKFGDMVTSKIYISIINESKEFPLTACLKRDNNALRDIGIPFDSIKSSDVIIPANDKVKTKIK